MLILKLIPIQDRILRHTDDACQFWGKTLQNILVQMTQRWSSILHALSTIWIKRQACTVCMYIQYSSRMCLSQIWFCPLYEVGRMINLSQWSVKTTKAAICMHAMKFAHQRIENAVPVSNGLNTGSQTFCYSARHVGI